MEHLINLLIGLFAVSCCTIIWVRGEPFARFKQELIDHAGRFDIWVAYLVSCTMCSGVWFGLGSYLFVQPYLIGKQWWIELPLWAAMVGVTSIAMERAIWHKGSFMEPTRLTESATVERLRD